MMLLRIAVVLSVALLMVHALNSALIGQKRMSKFALHSSTFRSSFGSDIPDWLHANLEKLGYSEPTVAQQESLPLIFQGEDVILQSQTGSGKTLAYSLPILSQIDTSRSAIQAVIVVPTRELGMQVSAVLKQLSSGAPEKVMIMPLMEGSKNRRQQLWAVAEPPHIVVGNPRSLQRIVDLGRLKLNAVSFVVLDEVDACLINPETRRELHTLLSRQLSSSYQTVDNVLGDASSNLQGMGGSGKKGGAMQENLVYSNLAKQDREMAAKRDLTSYKNDRQTILCSATIPQRHVFATNCFKNGWTQGLPKVVHVSAANLAPPQVKHEYVPIFSKPLSNKAKLKSQIQTQKEEAPDAAGEEQAFQLQLLSALRHVIASEAVLWEQHHQEQDAVIDKDKDKDIDVDEPAAAAGAGVGEEAMSLSNTNTPMSTPFQVLIFCEDPDEAMIKRVRKSVQSGLQRASQKLQTTGGIEPTETTKTTKKGGSTGLGEVQEVQYLSESLSLDERASVLKSFVKGPDGLLADKESQSEFSGGCRALVCSPEVASRGIDVPSLSLVIMLGLPELADEYVHRAGRTGRMGKYGKVISFVKGEQDFVIARLENSLGLGIRRRELRLNAKTKDKPNTKTEKKENIEKENIENNRDMGEGEEKGTKRMLKKRERD